MGGKARMGVTSPYRRNACMAETKQADEQEQEEKLQASAARVD